MTQSRRILQGCAAAALIAATSLAIPALAAPQKLLIETQKGTLSALNRSGASGTISMQLRGQRYLTVQIDATGLEPGVAHVGHIHGRVEVRPRPANSTCPKPRAGRGQRQLCRARRRAGYLRPDRHPVRQRRSGHGRERPLRSHLRPQREQHLRFRVRQEATCFRSICVKSCFTE